MGLVLITLIVNLMAAINFYGNLHYEVTKEKVNESEERRSFLCGGVLQIPAATGSLRTCS